MGTWAFTKTLHDAETAATANGKAIDTLGGSVVTFALSVTGTATVNFEASGDDGVYVAFPMANVATGVSSTSATATGLYRGNCGAFRDVRGRISGGSASTVTVRAIVSDEGIHIPMSATGGMLADTEISANVVWPGQNTEALSTLNAGIVRVVPEGVDTAGGINLSAMTVTAPTADAQTVSGTNFKALLVAALGYGIGGTNTADRLRVANVFKTVTAQAITAATGITIWTPAAGKKFRLMGYVFSSSAAASLKFYDGAGGALTTLIFQGPLLAAAGIDARDNIGNGRLSAAANNTLALDVSANATVSGTVWGIEE